MTKVIITEEIVQVVSVIQQGPTGPPGLDGVQSVTGLDTDNTDPQNPIVKLAVDGVTVTGAGTALSPLVAHSAVTSVFDRTGAVTAQSGDYNTAQVTESGNLYFTNARAIAAPLTGFSAAAGTVTASDTILSAFNKVVGNISGLVTGVSSVFSRTGAVTAQSGDYTTTLVTEGTNLYFTAARARAAITGGKSPFPPLPAPNLAISPVSLRRFKHSSMQKCRPRAPSMAMHSPLISRLRIRI